MEAPGTIIFSHGNGFPAGTYRQMLEVWREAGWRVEALPMYGHDPAHPVTSNWPRLRDQLIGFASGLPVTPGPRVLIGHSMGGLLSLKAALHRPELADAVLLLDSPVVGGWRAQSVRLAKATRLIARVSPGRIAARRRMHWPSVDAARAHFGAKSIFARWAPGVLDDYLACGLVPAGRTDADGVRLAFDRQVEARIYDTLPHTLDRLIARQPLRCPVGFLAGTQSRELRQAGLAATRRLVGERLQWIEGSHLFPMEKPGEAARRVLEMLAGMPGGRHAAAADAHLGSVFQ